MTGFKTCLINGRSHGSEWTPEASENGTPLPLGEVVTPGEQEERAVRCAATMAGILAGLVRPWLNRTKGFFGFPTNPCQIPPVNSVKAAAAIVVLLVASSAAQAQVGWSVGKFVKKFPDTVATWKFNQCLLHAHTGGADIVCFAANDHPLTAIRMVVYRPEFQFSRGDVIKLMSVNGPDLDWTPSDVSGDEFWYGKKGDEEIMYAVWKDGQHPDPLDPLGDNYLSVCMKTD